VGHEIRPQARVEAHISDYVRTVKRYQGKGDARRLVEVQQRVSPWWRTGPDRKTYFFIRARGKAVELEPGKSAIVVGSPSEIPELIDQLIQLVRASELDTQLVGTKSKKTEKVQIGGKGKRAAA
jgi:hypothetical protein